MTTTPKIFATGTPKTTTLDGERLLDDLHATLKRYVVFPSEQAAAAVTLWIAATHAAPAFDYAPRLVFTSPQKRCGKSRALRVVGGTCFKQLPTANASTAAIFRSVGGEHPPTVLMDEFDAMFGTKRAAENNEDLRGLVNAGAERGFPVLRCVGQSQIPTPFDPFAFMAIAGIGRVPDTIEDRAIVVPMRRRASGEKISPFRSRRDGPILAALRDRLTKWLQSRMDELRAAEPPQMPIDDRDADKWEPLIMVADLADGHWPATARDACEAIVNSGDDGDEQSLGIGLLVDIRRVFSEKGATFLPSAELVAALRRIDESPWNDFELTASKLAYRLKEYGIKPGHNTARTARGYELWWFADTFLRYTRPDPSRPSETTGEQQQQLDGLRTGGQPDSSDPSEPSRPVQTEPVDQPLFTDGWTGPDTLGVRNGHTVMSAGSVVRRPGCVCTGQPQPCQFCRLAASKPQPN